MVLEELGATQLMNYKEDLEKTLAKGQPVHKGQNDRSQYVSPNNIGIPVTAEKRWNPAACSAWKWHLRKKTMDELEHILPGG